MVQIANIETPAVIRIVYIICNIFTILGQSSSLFFLEMREGVYVIISSRSMYAGQAQLLRSHSLERFSFELSGNLNESMPCYLKLEMRN